MSGSFIVYYYPLKLRVPIIPTAIYGEFKALAIFGIQR
jgi:hypothetical protein